MRLGRTPRWVRGLKLLQDERLTLITLGRTPRWVRGLKFESAELNERVKSGRTPRWVRGLKCCIWFHQNEMQQRRTPRWVRGLKYKGQNPQPVHQGRTPRWVRGLKSRSSIKIYQKLKSHPTMGAWIEIDEFWTSFCSVFVAPHDGCVDWNLCDIPFSQSQHSRTPRWVRGLKYVIFCIGNVENGRTPRWVRGLKSLPVVLSAPNIDVAPHDGCVDWNISKCWRFDKVWCRTPRWVRGLKFRTSALNQLG